MSDAFDSGFVIAGAAGTAVAGPAGGLVFGAIGGLLAKAYAQKPVSQSFATTVANDLRPENVTLDAHQIWLRITSGHGPGSLAEAHSAAKDLADRFTQRAGEIAAALTVSGQVWQGAAADAAAAATTPLTDSFAMARQQLATNSQALDAELGAFDHIRAQVEFVPPEPPQSGIANAVNPFQTDVDAAINDYNAKAAKNVQLYEAYSADTAAARTQVSQAYLAPTPLTGSVAPAAGTGSPLGASAAPPPLAGSAPDAGPSAGTATSASGGPSPAPPQSGGVSGTPGGSAGTGATATDSAGRAPQASPISPTSPTSPTATTPGAVPPLPAAGGPFGGSPSTGRFPSSGPGGGRGGGGPGMAGFGPVTRGGGPGAGTGTGARPAVRGGPLAGAGPVPGQTPPGQAVRGGLGGGAAARGGTGVGGTPAGAAGRGDKEEDQEHRRKYLIEPDRDELFGTDEPCAPPVIGDRRPRK
jgi:hypothetical protein